MQATFLLGPAGSGKTHRCLAEIRAELMKSAEGLPLVLLAPKQATFELERQLLADGSLPGYTRLQILSFERLAEFVLAEFAAVPPKLLNDDGRVMVLRALLARKQTELKIFRATARLPGFAQQLSLLLRELQRHQQTPGKLLALAGRIASPPHLGDKLSDLALLLHAYLDWLKEHQLQDAECLLDLAAEVLRAQSAMRAESVVKATEGKQRTADHPAVRFAGLWLDGFAEMTPQELDFLAALTPHCERATLAFCLESQSDADCSWLSTWLVVSQSFRSCRQRLASLPECKVTVEVLERKTDHGRFAENPALAHLERHWENPKPFEGGATGKFHTRDEITTACSRRREEADRNGLHTGPPPPDVGGDTGHEKFGLAPLANVDRRDACATLRDALRVAVCPHPEAEAVLAAREILRHARAGGRFRDCAVLLRALEGYDDALRRVFRRYEIPFFLDRREPVAHHPLAELTRCALRTVAFDWEANDWFGALKSGLVNDDDEDGIDRLENEALARGWKGEAWRQPLKMADNEPLARRLEPLRQRIVPPFQQLAGRLAADTAAPPQRGPTGARLAAALREFWGELEVEKTLAKWGAAAPDPSAIGNRRSAIHSTVWDQMQSWLDNVELAFADEPMSLREWLPVLEAGLSGLTVGVIPPALDQVLIGAVDRSRNPELKLTLVLGLNQGVFPASPAAGPLLTEPEREAIAAHGAALGPSQRLRLGHERYFGYIACTRARQRLLLSCARANARGRKLNPSPFLDHVARLFPQLEIEDWQPPLGFPDAEHFNEIVPPIIRLRDSAPGVPVVEWLALPRLAPIVARADQVRNAAARARLTPAQAELLYGHELTTSLTALEDFAACPFKFFVGRGLDAAEREDFELDARERGSFQHEVLSAFHQRLEAKGRKWRDISAGEARLLARNIGRERLPAYRGGLLLADATRRFAADTLLESLETLIEILVGWARDYQFDPVCVEAGFGLPGVSWPAWRLGLDDGRALLLRGRIDRVDVWRDAATGATLVVVVDYKSSGRKPDQRKLYHGLELQLPAYLAALEQLSEARQTLRADRLVPAGIFFVNLRGDFGSTNSRAEALDDPETALRKGFQHVGRYEETFLDQLDLRRVGEQFKISNRSQDRMNSAAFRDLLNRAVENLRRFGEEIFAGKIAPEPYRKGNETACEKCDFAAVCRFDPWTQPFRALSDPPPVASPAVTSPESKRSKPAAQRQ